MNDDSGVGYNLGRAPVIGKVNLYTVMQYADSPDALIDAYGLPLRTARQGVYVAGYRPACSEGQGRYSITDAVSGKEILSWPERCANLENIAERARTIMGNKSDLIIHNNHYSEVVRILDILDLDYEEFMPLREGGRCFVKLRPI